MRPWWRSTIRLQIDSPMPLPGYSSRPCRRLKTLKMRSAWRGSMPMPLSDTRNSHASSLALGGHLDARRVLGPELDPVADQVLEQLAQLALVAPHARQLADRRRWRPPRRRSSACPPSVSRTSSAHVDRAEPVLRRAGARVGEQVVDQALHAVHAVDREPDELVRVRVELALVAARQQLHVARHHAQRLGEVVRGDVGELLQVGVRALELRRRGAPAPRRRSRGGPRVCLRRVMSCTCAIPYSRRPEESCAVEALCITQTVAPSPRR